MHIEPEFTEGNHTVTAGLSVRTEFVGEGNQCDRSESPSDGASDLKHVPMPSANRDARCTDAHRIFLSVLPEVHLVATAVVKSAGEMRTPKRSHQMITL